MHGPLTRNAHLGNLAREFPATVKPEPEFLQEITGHIWIVGAFHSPEAKAVFIFLKQLERCFQLLHGAVEGRRKEIDGQCPSKLAVLERLAVSGVPDTGSEHCPDSDVIFADRKS